MENEPKDLQLEQLSELADELERIALEKTGGEVDVVMQKLIARLRARDAYAAKVFLSNESDKFTQYREDAVPLIIEKLYCGSGSPWFTIERKLNK